ncbi:hypothetical protein PC128_g27630 [Phytophthora cactorum]|nr:hypothetical protein C6341_g27729 [Phytophthora cactorum]KAG3123391.1 hypothetical protein PC128_g27630 [Phytophthora cactorum]
MMQAIATAACTRQSVLSVSAMLLRGERIGYSTQMNVVNLRAPMVVDVSLGRSHFPDYNRLIDLVVV